jgi:hypothetical protein
MSVDAIFGVLFVALFGLIGAIWRIVWTRLQKIDSGALAQFTAKDAERERAWWEWRKQLDDDRKARHDDLTRRLDSHAHDIKDHERRITRIERNGH